MARMLAATAKPKACSRFIFNAATITRLLRTKGARMRITNNKASVRAASFFGIWLAIAESCLAAAIVGRKTASKGMARIQLRMPVTSRPMAGPCTCRRTCSMASSFAAGDGGEIVEVGR